MSYGIVRLDKVRSVYKGHIHSVKYDADILENGMIGVLGDLLPNEREIRELKVPTGTDEPIVLIYAPEYSYEDRRISDRALENFHIEAGVPARAYELEAMDMFSVSKKMVTPLDANAGVTKGNFVVAQAGSLIMAENDGSALTGDEAFLGKIVDVEIIGTSTVVGQAGVISRIMELVVVEVLKNRR